MLLIKGDKIFLFYSLCYNKFMKKKIIIFLILLLLGFISYGYYRFSGILRENRDAKKVLLEGKRYNLIKNLILKEDNRCQVFITQKEGDFGSFEYCKKFIQWSKNIPLE
jgi:hypothetical protein